MVAIPVENSAGRSCDSIHGREFPRLGAARRGMALVPEWGTVPVIGGTRRPASEVTFVTSHVVLSGSKWQEGPERILVGGWPSIKEVAHYGTCPE